MTELRVGVLGPGGVGGLIAGTLARNGAEVTCIASESTAAVIAAQGLSIESDRFGTFRQPVRAESSLSSPLDVLCVAVKATGLVESLDRITTKMLKDAIVVPFLNGAEHVSILRERLAPARVVAATIRIESAGSPLVRSCKRALLRQLSWPQGPAKPPESPNSQS